MARTYTPVPAVSVPLTEAQRKLVEQYLPLVRAYVKRRAGRSQAGIPARRDFGELFQEACWGLVQAVQAYRPERGVAFSSFARRRVQAAVSRALRDGASLVRTPTTRPRRRPGRAAEPTRPEQPLRVFSLRKDPIDRRPTAAPAGGSTARTIGDRLREKYELAVRSARVVGQRHRARRRDRMKLVERLIERRHTIPEKSMREPLRQVAEVAGASATNALELDRRIEKHVRRVLAGDPELERLRDWARRAKEGVDRVLEPEQETELRALEAAWFARKFRHAPPEARDQILQHMVSSLGAEVEPTIRSMYGTLGPELANALMAKLLMLQ